MDTWLHSIGYSLGEPVDVSDIVPRAGEERWLDFLKQDGFATFRIFPRDMLDHLVEAVFRTLESACLDGADVHGVVFCSDSMTHITRCGPAERESYYRRIFEQVILRCGLKNSAVYGLWMNGCANALFALTAASGLVRSGLHSNMLLVFVEQTLPDESRIMPAGASILSDCAAACILDLNGSGWEIRGIESIQDASLALTSSPVSSLKVMRSLAKRISAHVERTGHKPEALIIDNLNSIASHALCLSLALEFETCLQPLKSNIGHAHSMDGLLSLACLVGEGRLGRGNRVAWLTSSTWAWGFVDLLAGEGV